MKTTIIGQWNGPVVKSQGKKVVNKSSFEIGLVVEGQAKLLAPRKTGLLAASITTQSKTDGSTPESPALASDTISKPVSDMEVLVGTPIEYGPHMEFGTVKTDAQPFLRPALALARGESLSIIEIEGKKHFREYLK